MKETIYEYTWLNGCVTYGKMLTDEERAKSEQKFGKLVRQVKLLHFNQKNFSKSYEKQLTSTQFCDIIYL